MPRIRGVGAAAPSLRVTGGRHRRRVGPRAAAARSPCARPTKTRSRSRGTPATARPRRGRDRGRRRRRDLLGDEPPAVRRRPEPRVPRRRARACRPTVGGGAALGLDARGHGSAARGRRRDRRRLGPRRARRRVRRAAARTRHRLRSALRRGRGRARARADGGAAALGTRVTRTRPFVDRYRGDGETDNRDLYDAPAVPRRDLPAGRRRRRDDARRRSTSTRGRSPTPTAGSAPSVAKSVGADAPASSAVYAAIGDTGAAAALLGAHRARSTRRASSPIVGTGGGRTTGRAHRTSTRRSPARPRRRRARATGGPRSYAEVLRVARPARPGRRDDPDGRAARERDVRARRRRDARPARRSLRRLRHDQHAAVDPPALHQLRRPEARAGRARARRRRCTRSS